MSNAASYTWKSKYGGLEVSKAKRLPALEAENTELKRLMADVMLDNDGMILDDGTGLISDIMISSGGGVMAHLADRNLDDDIKVKLQQRARQHRRSRKRRCGKYCAMPSGTIVEQAVLGSIPFRERPQGSRLLLLGKAGDVIIVTNLDRTFRSADCAL